MRIDCFYINLDRDFERRVRFEKEAKRIGLKAKRFPGFLGIDIPDRYKPYFTRYGQIISRGEIGCYASHLALCEQLCSDQEHDAYLILEDDVIFEEDFTLLISEISCLNLEWDRIHLCGHAKFSIREIEKISNYSLVTYSKIPTNGAAYIISKSGAKKFLKFRYVKRALDHDFQRDWQFQLLTFGIFPRPVNQKGNMVSSIDTIDPRKNSIFSKFFKDTPADVLCGLIYSVSIHGLKQYLMFQLLNLRIEAIRFMKKKRVLFIQKNSDIVQEEIL